MGPRDHPHLRDVVVGSDLNIGNARTGTVRVVMSEDAARGSEKLKVAEGHLGSGADMPGDLDAAVIKKHADLNGSVADCAFDAFGLESGLARRAHELTRWLLAMAEPPLACRCAIVRCRTAAWQRFSAP